MLAINYAKQMRCMEVPNFELVSGGWPDTSPHQAALPAHFLFHSPIAHPGYPAFASSSSFRFRRPLRS